MLKGGALNLFLNRINNWDYPNFDNNTYFLSWFIGIKAPFVPYLRPLLSFIYYLTPPD